MIIDLKSCLNLKDFKFRKRRYLDIYYFSDSIIWLFSTLGKTLAGPISEKIMNFLEKEMRSEQSFPIKGDEDIQIKDETIDYIKTLEETLVFEKKMKYRGKIRKISPK